MPYIARFKVEKEKPKRIYFSASNEIPQKIKFSAQRRNTVKLKIGKDFKLDVESN